MKRLSILVLGILLTFSAYAADQSEPIFLQVTGRVCEQTGKCQRYNGDSGNFQVELSKNQNGLSGEMTLSYEIEGVMITNSVFVSKYEFNGKLQTEVYLEIKNSLSDLSKTGVSVVVNSLSQLNWLSPTGAVFEVNGKKVIPELVLGPVSSLNP